SSIRTSQRSISPSRSTICCETSTSGRPNSSTALCTTSSTTAHIDMMCWCSVSRSRVRWIDILILEALAEAAGDVVYRLFLPGPGEQLRRLVHFDHPALVEKRSEVADPRRLLHVVRDDHDRVASLELEN